MTPLTLLPSRARMKASVICGSMTIAGASAPRRGRRPRLRPGSAASDGSPLGEAGLLRVDLRPCCLMYSERDGFFWLGSGERRALSPFGSSRT